MKQKIATLRKCDTWVSNDVLYEWEDLCVTYFNGELLDINKPVFRRIINRLRAFLKSPVRLPFVLKRRPVLAFVMNPGLSIYYKGHSVIPNYLDVAEEEIDAVIKETKKLPFYFVTSLDVQKIINNRCGDTRCKFMPQSISDKYYTKQIAKKTLDVLQLGRKNPKLHEFMLRYCEEHPTVEYVYRNPNKQLCYNSTTRGDIGAIESREDFINLLSSAKISLVSTPSIDCSRYFGNIDFVTARVYESAAFYCHMIGRYTENEEVEKIGLTEICTCVKTYEEFSVLVGSFLQIDNQKNIEKYDSFLKQHVTSQRCVQFENELMRSKQCKFKN